MAFQKITVNKTDVYASFADEIKITIPGQGSVSLTKDSFVKLLNYFKGYDFTLAKQEIDRTYYPVGKKNLGYFVESTDGKLIIVDVNLTKIGKYSDVTFKTLNTDTATVEKELAIGQNILARIIDAAAVAGITSDAKQYAGIVFVDSLPAETSAQRNTVYLFDGKYYTLNEAEDALDEIEKVEERRKLPETKSSAVEGDLYNLTRVDEEPDFKLTFKPGLYTYTAASNTFVLQDLTLKKTDALPEKGAEGILYQLTKDQVVSETETRKKGTRYTFAEGKYTEDKRVVHTTNHLPLVELAVDGTYYLVDGTVSKFADGKFTKVGRVVKAKHGLPDVTTVKINSDYIYTLNKDDGEKARCTSWVFDDETKAFKEYEDPSVEKAASDSSKNA